MADNPFDQFDAPSQPQGAPAAASSNPFDQFDKPTESASPQRSTAEDVGLGLIRGPIKGLGELVGFGSDLSGMIERGRTWLLTKGAEKLGLITPQHGDEIRGLVNTQQSGFDSDHITHYLLGLADKAGIGAPTTPYGQAAQNVTSFLPGAAVLGRASSLRQLPGALMKYGVIPGATSEAAGEATKGTAAEPYARVAGALAPAILGDGASLARLGNPVARSLEGLTPERAQAAQDLLDYSRRVGSPLASTEAVGYATNNATNMANLQRVVENSPEGGAITRPFFAQRPDQVKSFGRETFDQIAPPITDPFSVAPNVQKAAQGVVNDADQARTAAVRPLYQSAAADNVPVPEMDHFISRLDGMIKSDRTGLISPQLQRFRNALVDEAGNPITDIENLDNARKYFRDQIAQPAIAQDAVPKQVGARLGSLVGELDNMMERASPDFAAAKQRYQDITKSTVEPLQQSPTGQLANANSFETQAQILFDPNPPVGSHVAIGNAVRQIAARDPEAARQMVRMFVEQTFNKATKELISGPNQAGGAKFANAIAGESQQALNLQAAIEALPNGQTIWRAFSRAQDVFKAMGTRQPTGSQTAFNQQLAKRLESRGALPDLAAVAASPGRWLTYATDIYHRYAFGRNTAGLAQAMVSGDVRDLQRIASANPNSLQAQTALIAVLANEGARSQQSAGVQ